MIVFHCFGIEKADGLQNAISLQRKIGKNNSFSAVVHMDEKTPHMHLCFTPITQDGRMTAKEIIGNRVQLTKWQDDFFAHMVKSFPNIERGQSKCSYYNSMSAV